MGLGDADAEGAVVLSWGIDEGFREAEAAVAGGGISFASESRRWLLAGVARAGTAVRCEVPTAAGSEEAGEADKDGALKGWNDNEGRRPWPLSPERIATLADCPVFSGGLYCFWEGELVGDVVPSSRAARNADIGLPSLGPT